MYKVFILLFLFGFSCKIQLVSKDKVVILQINSYLKNCVGVGPMQCLQIKENNQKDWSLWYSGIEGFIYKPGYIYKLKVKKRHLNEANLPADKSSIVYQLLEVVEKTPDSQILLHDIYVIKTMNDSNLSNLNISTSLEINTTTNKFYLNNTCTEINGDIAGLTNESIFFGTVNQGSKNCENETISSQIISSLSKVTNYKREGLSLILLNNKNEKLFELKKVD